MKLRTTYKIKHRKKYDTDKYERKFCFIGDDGEMPSRSVWEADVYVGPEAYNKGHIDNILMNNINDPDTVTDDNNPWYTTRATLSKERIKFAP